MAVNWSQGAKGGLGGAATGATIGSFGGPIGAGIGAGAGGLIGFLASLFGSSGDDSGAQNGVNAQGFGQTPSRFNPEQQEALKMLLQQGTKGLQNPYEGFEPIENRAREQFATQTVPGLAERFTALGGQSKQGSSAFTGALGAAGSNLDRDLAVLRSQYGMENKQNALQQLQTGLTPQFEHVYFGKPSQLGSKLFETGAENLGPLVKNIMDMRAQQQQTGQVKKSGVQFTPQQSNYLVNLLKSQQAKA